MSRGAKVTIGTVLVLVLVLAAGYAADRVTAQRTEQAITDELTEAAGGQGVQTDIAGPLFLPQVIGGSLDQVDVRADQVQLQDLVIADVTGTAHGVSVDEPRTADRLSVTGTLPVQTLRSLLGQSDLVPDGLELDVTDGRLVAELSVLGATLRATADPVVRDGSIYLQPRELTLGGVQLDLAHLPGAVDEVIGSLAVPTDALPEGISPAAIDVTDGGIRLTVTGTDLTLSELSQG
ncbi:DUF2993 domain-containing protein [Ruania zhangjianzhongii]|uniref:LmeA family phospholipid-binding protein n=1 Tax=Ruania zhangjianzhongii TaxID=2603206 RepID=UPI0011C8B48E|nr:DUF2993 domain-containing protein [Ruania zhangjianzhongii]